MARQVGMEAWEEQLAREGAAISQMHKHLGRPATRGARIIGTRLNRKVTQVATVQRRDAAALHVGFAPDRIYG